MRQDGEGGRNQVVQGKTREINPVALFLDWNGIDREH